MYGVKKMLKYILIALCLIFALFGLSEFLHLLKLKFISGNKAATYSLLLLSDNMPDRQIAYAGEQRLWHGNAYADHIIAVNAGISDKDNKLCRDTANKYGIDYCTADKLGELLNDYIGTAKNYGGVPNGGGNNRK